MLENAVHIVYTRPCFFRAALRVIRAESVIKSRPDYAFTFSASRNNNRHESCYMLKACDNKQRRIIENSFIRILCRRYRLIHLENNGLLIGDIVHTENSRIPFVPTGDEYVLIVSEAIGHSRFLYRGAW